MAENARALYRLLRVESSQSGDAAASALATGHSTAIAEAMAKYVVATVDEIPPGGRKIVEVGRALDRRLQRRRRVLRAAQPLPAPGRAAVRGARLRRARLVRRRASIDYSRPGEILRCPWHGWEFDIRTGQSWFDPRKVRVRRYDVSGRAGRGRRDGDGGERGDGMEPGPYVAETYPGDGRASSTCWSNSISSHHRARVRVG